MSILRMPVSDVRFGIGPKDIAMCPHRFVGFKRFPTEAKAEGTRGGHPVLIGDR